MAPTKAAKPAASQTQHASSHPNAAAESSSGVKPEAAKTGHQTGAVVGQASSAVDRAASAWVAKAGAAQQVTERPKAARPQSSVQLPAGASAQPSDSQSMDGPDAVGFKMQKTSQQEQGASASQARDATGGDSAAHGSESQVVGKHAASTAKPMS